MGHRRGSARTRPCRRPRGVTRMNENLGDAKRPVRVEMGEESVRHAHLKLEAFKRIEEGEEGAAVAAATAAVLLGLSTSGSLGAEFD